MYACTPPGPDVKVSTRYFKVRIFFSSTFTDMLMERNTLMEYVYPKIKEYCREKHGLEFQVTAIDEKKMSKKCLI
jgi:hypothetical protein